MPRDLAPWEPPDIPSLAVPESFPADTKKNPAITPLQKVENRVP